MPVNPDLQSISGVLAYKDIASLPVVPDLAILTTSLEEAPTLIGELGALGTKGALLLSREVLQAHQSDASIAVAQETLGKPLDEGEALKQKILETAKPYLLGS